MDTHAFMPAAFERIRNIHQLSIRYNQLTRYPHRKRLLDLVSKHAEEIRDLCEKGDLHYVVESGDLAILCFELMLEEGRSPDEVIAQCFRRYEDKLNFLIRDQEKANESETKD